MAYIEIGKLRVVSVSQTALERDIAIEHILHERLEGGKNWGKGQYPGSFYAETACRKKIFATTAETWRPDRKKQPSKQVRQPCLLCNPEREGGEWSMRLVSSVHDGALCL